MTSLETSAEPAAPVAPPHQPRVWKFWGTLLWGIFAFVAMFLGQIVVVAYVLATRDASLDLGISERTLYRKLKEYDIEDL